MGGIVTPRPSATIRAIQRGEGTTGEEYKHPPGPRESTLYHPDWPSHRTTGTLAAEFTSYDFACFAECNEHFEACLTESQDDPKTLNQAQSRSDWSDWQLAMDREIATLKKASTWTTVP